MVEETEVGERRQFQFLYKQGEQLVFMDTNSYEQIELPEEFVGERASFLHYDGMNVQLQLHPGSADRHQAAGDGRARESSRLTPTIKGQTAASSYKSAKLENGLRIQVPPFIATGEKVIVSTDEVAYVKRAD